MNLTTRTPSSDRIKIAIMLLLALMFFFRAELKHLLPHGSADEVQYLIGKAADAVNRGDFKHAIELSDSVLKQHANAPNIQRAHMVKGLALLKSGNRADATREFQTVTTKYANTKEAQPASNALVNLALTEKKTPEPALPPPSTHEDKPTAITPQANAEPSHEEPSPLIMPKGSVAGQWGGVGPGGNLGLCNLTLQIHDTQGQLTGKSVLRCTVNAESYKPAWATTIMSFTGTSTNGNAVIDHFELIDRTKNSSPCLIHGITLNRIGPQTLIAQYHDELCGGHGGQITLAFGGNPPEPEAPKPIEKITPSKSQLAGIWQGAATLEDRGLCAILLDLHGDLTADVRMECRKTQGQGNPDVFVTHMSGIGWSGPAAQLREDRILQRPYFAKQCLANEFTVSVIAGTDKILAEWNDNAPCKEFKAILEPHRD